MCRSLQQTKFNNPKPTCYFILFSNQKQRGKKQKQPFRFHWHLWAALRVHTALSLAHRNSFPLSPSLSHIQRRGRRLSRGLLWDFFWFPNSHRGISRGLVCIASLRMRSRLWENCYGNERGLLLLIDRNVAYLPIINLTTTKNSCWQCVLSRCRYECEWGIVMKGQ